ncbi:hypothetical protein PHLCEN_2v9755 [Hermanssonia centrifuga]|uniref:Uncharacterized protein n=1 Tax=Hermanssonia centrifuga TaxID=98765 RepID=A0A2R6NPZ0_9APHY|nr:hypothetical protein PHLCEN_2v9755 [Hermanssonia centrifuga]
MARFHDEIYSDPDSLTGLNERVDFREIALRHDVDLSSYFEDWTRRFAEDSDMDDPACKFRASLLPFFTNYSRLVMYSFAFQQAFRRGISIDDQLVVDKCFKAATDVILAMLDGLAPSGFERYAPDSHFIFATFASAFLLKLLKPEFAVLVKKDQEEQIFQLIGRLIQNLNSPEIAIDDRHTPRLHARFLASLLSRHKRDVASSTRSQQTEPPQGQTTTGSAGRSTTQPGTDQASMQQVFSMSPVSSPQGNIPQTQPTGRMHTPPDNAVPVEQVYQQETYTADASPDVLDFDSNVNGAFEEELFGGALLALKSSSYWDNMMMPG